jgi:hypothetical protein
MSTDNVDLWYDAQKEKLTQKYISELKKGVKKEEAEKNFKKDMQTLHKKYTDSYENSLKQPKISVFIRTYFKKFDKKSREILSYLAENFGDEQ